MLKIDGQSDPDINAGTIDIDPGIGFQALVLIRQGAVDRCEFVRKYFNPPPSWKAHPSASSLSTSKVA